jgi:hypothetical protein
MASEAKDSRVNAAFVECARQWRELARQKEFLLDRLLDRPESP